MSIALRILLLLFSLIAFISVIKKIRKSSLLIEDALFWVLFSFSIILIALFPSIIYKVSEILNIKSPANFLYLLIIAILIIKIFFMSIKISDLENKIKILAQKISLDELE